MSTLYVVATPIGNLEDISPRALRVLREADLILAEDTRVTVKLLNAFSIKKPLESYHQHNENLKTEQVIARMLEEDLKVALVTDAGTPAVSDPGALLVAAAHQAGIPVFAVPGPSAFAAALSVAGFEETSFAFYGFLPRKPKELRDSLRSLRQGPNLAVLYEAPQRVLALLQAIREVHPGCMVSVSRELSKLHEQTIHGGIDEVLARFEQEPGLLRGEFVLVIAVPPLQKETVLVKETGLEGQLVDALVKGRNLRDAMADLVASGQRKNMVYAASLKLKALAHELAGGVDKPS